MNEEQTDKDAERFLKRRFPNYQQKKCSMNEEQTEEEQAEQFLKRRFPNYPPKNEATQLKTPSKRITIQNILNNEKDKKF